MNEQIKQLWLKAAREDSSETWDTQEQFIERFAEKIVQECMDVVAKKCASPTAYQALAEHWGVEL